MLGTSSRGLLRPLVRSCPVPARLDDLLPGTVVPGLVALAAVRVGAGDVAIVVERDQLVAGSAVDSAEVWWTFDETLVVHAAARP